MSTIKTFDLVGIGVAAVDDLLYVAEYPTANVKTPITWIERHGGGPACTAVAAVSCLQGKSAYVARLGQDDLSSFIDAALRDRGVDVSCLIHDVTAAPYHSYIVADRAGNRNVFFDTSRFRPVTVGDIPQALIESAKTVLLDHVADPAPVAVAEMINSRGVPILGDIECCSESALRLAQLVDYLVVPAEFAHWASGTRNTLNACGYLSRTHRTATVVTAGAAGCYHREGNNGDVTHVPAFEVQAFDTNGCGDTFHGAFGLGIARGLSVRDSVTFASAAAAIKASSDGGKHRGWNALPTLSDMVLFLRSRDQSELLDKIITMETTECGQCAE